jgi:hypothetical protein
MPRDERAAQGEIALRIARVENGKIEAWVRRKKIKDAEPRQDEGSVTSVTLVKSEQASGRIQVTTPIIRAP